MYNHIDPLTSLFGVIKHKELVQRVYSLDLSPEIPAAVSTSWH